MRFLKSMRMFSGTSDVVVKKLSMESGPLVLEYEQVRPVSSVQSIYNRMTGNKAIYGLYSNLELQAFCSVALIKGDLNADFLSNIGMHEDYTQDDYDNVVFYSVNAITKGAGVAGPLLKAVMRKINSKAFLTFSPIPHLSKHISRHPEEEEVKEHLVTKCPVYRFHTRNGAVLDKLFRDGDRSELGMQQSYGWQVSYQYK